MTDNKSEKYIYYTKVAWVVYSLLALVLACVLVFFVARDNEEMFFYGFMTVASAYVFRPTEKFFGKLIFKFTSVSRPTEKE
jgi:lipopolysaccharide export LptBFGC system permease protein LptF